MTKKEDFVKLFKEETDEDPVKMKDNPKRFAWCLNGGSPELRSSFREAVEESSEPAAGLGLLFPGL